MRSASSHRVLTRWLTLPTLLAGFFSFLLPFASAQHSVVDTFPRPFFVPRDPYTGKTIPGPPLPDHLTEPLGTLDSLSDEQCLHLYKEMLAQPPTEEVAAALNKILAAFAQPNRRVPLSQLLSISDPAFVHGGWYSEASSFASSWEEAKPEETARWLADQGGRFLDSYKVSDLTGYVGYLWGEEDPRAASEFLVHVPLAANLPSGYDPNTSLYHYLRRIVHLRSGNDLLGTLAWAKVLPDTDQRRTPALVGVMDRMAESDPAQAKDFVQRQIGLEKCAPELAAQLVVDLAGAANTKAHGEAIGQWVLTLPDPPVRRAALESLVNVWLTKMDVEWRVFNELPRVIVWANSLPASEVRGEVWAVVAATWGPMLPYAAKNWLLGLPTGPDRDNAIAAYEQAIIDKAKKMIPGHGGYSQAMHYLSLTLLDQKRAAELIDILLAEWTQKDPAQAREWAAGHGKRMPSAAVGN